MLQQYGPLGSTQTLPYPIQMPLFWVTPYIFTLKEAPKIKNKIKMNNFIITYSGKERKWFSLSSRTFSFDNLQMRKITGYFCQFFPPSSSKLLFLTFQNLMANDPKKHHSNRHVSNLTTA